MVQARGMFRGAVELDENGEPKVTFPIFGIRIGSKRKAIPGECVPVGVVRGNPGEKLVVGIVPLGGEESDVDIVGEYEVREIPFPEPLSPVPLREKQRVGCGKPESVAGFGTEKVEWNRPQERIGRPARGEVARLDEPVQAAAGVTALAREQATDLTPRQRREAVQQEAKELDIPRLEDERFLSRVRAHG